MKLCFVSVSSKLPSWLEHLSSDYSKKLSFWIPTEVRLLPNKNLSREEQGRKKHLESEVLVDFFKPDDYVVLCDTKGKELDSMSFAKRMENILNGGKKRVVVAIGGAYGVSEAVERRADFRWCLSQLTTNHHLALAFSMEQAYRAMTILKNVSYHNE